MLLILSALIPLLTYGVFSIITSRSAYFQTAVEGNKRTAIGTAGQIELYVESRLAILQGLANNINRTFLSKWQKEVMIKNYLLSFEGFREIGILDQTGHEVATSRVDEDLFNRSDQEFFRIASKGQPYFSKVFISNDLVPSMIIALPIKRANLVEGLVVGEIDLFAMWKLVDSIRIGQRGVAFIVSQSGLLLAHGDHERKSAVFKQTNLQKLTIVQAVIEGKIAAMSYQNELGTKVLGVGCPVQLLGWGVIIEQPASEAFQAATKMTRQLSLLMVIFLILMILIGALGGRYITKPIRELIEATRAIAGGDLSRRVCVSSEDELEELADSFNGMTEKLARLQEEIRLNERFSTFAKIAAGLVHDLKHPIKNIENCSKLVVRLYDDQEYRENFSKTVTREFNNINRFLDDLYHLTHPSSIMIIEIRAEIVLKEIIDPYINEANQQGIQIKILSQAQDVRIMADKFLFERIIKNLVTNALEAMPQGGLLSITLSQEIGHNEAASTAQPTFHGPKSAPITQTACQGQEMSPTTKTAKYGQSFVIITIQDTGVGMAPTTLSNLFTDFFTTKRKGVGLGLAMVKKNISELGGSITAESVEGQGSIFILNFPSAQDG